MNYREAVKAYQGLVKRGAADGGPNDYRQPGYDSETNTYYTPAEMPQPVTEELPPAPDKPVGPTLAQLPEEDAAGVRMNTRWALERIKNKYAKGGADVLQDNMQPIPMPELTPEQKYRAKLVEEADRIAKLKHYGMVGGGALVGGAGAGLLSYLLAPKMSGLGRFLTVTGGATAGGAAAHYGPGVIEDITNWLAARRAGKQTPNEAAQRDNMQWLTAASQTRDERNARRASKGM